MLPNLLSSIRVIKATNINKETWLGIQNSNGFPWIMENQWIIEDHTTKVIEINKEILGLEGKCVD